MSAAQQHTCCGADIFGIDIALIERHVGAIFAIEDQRKRLLVADAEDHQSRQPFGIAADAAHIDAFARQFFADEAAHVIGADAGDEPGFQPQPRCPHRGVGRAAAQIFCERAHIFEPPADLLAVEIDRGPSDRNQIKRALSLRHQSSRLGRHANHQRGCSCNTYSSSFHSATFVSHSFPTLGLSPRLLLGDLERVGNDDGLGDAHGGGE